MTNSAHWARRAGILLGLLLAAGALIGWRVAPGGQQLGLDLAITANSTGELGLSPAGRIDARSGMAPGAPLEASTNVANQTGRRLAVRLRALPSSRDLDRTLAVRVRAGGRLLFDGRLGELRDETPPFLLRRGESTRLAVNASLPPGATGWRGHIEDVTIELRSRPKP